MFKRARSFVDVWLFIITVLSRPSILISLISLFVLIGGIGFLYTDVVSKAWVAVLVGLGGLGKEVLPIIFRSFGAKGSSMKQDQRVMMRIENMGLPQDYLESGYQITECSSDSSERVVRSAKVDSFLRNNDLKVAKNSAYLKKLNDKLAINSKMYELALLCQYRKSYRSYPPRNFFNEKKACLATDINIGSNEVELFQGSYFHSFLTNEMTTRIIESVGSNPVPKFGGPDMFPCDQNSAGQYILKHIADSGMGNHIGISTLVHTSDGQLVMWRQSGSSQQNRDQLVPAGSGSCDWQDWEHCRESGSLLKFISFAMKRELVEESTERGMQLGSKELETKVLGFFRWVNRGGKPEFVGLSKLSLPASALKANVSEVDDPDHLQTVFPARNMDQLRACTEELVGRKNISIPLWMCLRSLEDAIDMDESSIAQFLSIE